MPDRPNILVIMSDEHDKGVLGCYGDPVVRTPNLDRLATEGVTFDTAYTTSPLCVPARLSFTAGKYISRCGAWSNDCWLPSDDYPSLPRILNAAGYESLLGGKQHYDATRRYGFADLYPSKRNMCHKTGRGERREADDTRARFDSWQWRSSQFRVGDDSFILANDREVTRRCGEFLRTRRREEPFFLFAGYLAPHFPLIVPDAYYQRYRDRVPMPAVPEGFLNGLPRNYQHLRYGFGLTETEDAVVRRGRELYWGLTDWLDDQVGMLMDSLNESEVADNTVVIYTSDHGENKGDHGLWWKNTMYEHSAGVPLIVRWPQRWAGGQRRAQACSFVDLVQTIAAIAGTETPEDWDGESMLDWLDDPDAPWRDLAVSEYYAHNISSGFAMLRAGRYKYVYHTPADETHPAERELYDMEDDPGEFTNLAALPEHRTRLRTMHRALIEELGEDPDSTEARCRADYARGYGRA